MRFHLFESRLDAHIRRSREYLTEANLARVEHQAAAEHHTALAHMYAERIARLEAEIQHALQPAQLTAARQIEESERGGNNDSVVYPVYPARATRS